MFVAKKHLNRSMGMMAPFPISNFKGEIIDLSIGDIDCHTNPKIIHSALSDALAGHTHYTHAKGYPELREAISDYHKNNFKNYTVNSNDILVTSGGCHGMFLTLQSILDVADEVIIFSPYFPVYKDQVELCGGIPVIIPLKEEDAFQINLETLKSKITSKTKAIIVNTPSNPTGVCLSLESLNSVRKVAIENNLLVIADDIYDFYSYDVEFTPIYTLPNMAERTISVCSFSKNFAMTGWRIAYILGPSEIINCANSINENIVYSTSSVSQRAAIAALKNVEEIKNSLKPIYKERIEYAYSRIKNIKFLDVVKPQGGIYIFVNIEKTGLSTSEFCKLLYVEKGIKTIPGDIFGSDKHVRISLIGDTVLLKEVFDRIETLTL